MKHISVLQDEVLDKMELKPNGIYVDATLGLGGHTRLMANAQPEARIIAFDQDEDAIKEAKEILKNCSNVTIIKSNFANLKNELKKIGFEKIDGILYDLGTSYYQLTDEERGFTYHGDAKLDMRMDKSSKLSAIEVINEYREEDLAEIFWKYGDEKQSRKLAKAIVSKRQEGKITRNTELNEIIKQVKGFNKDKHPSKNIYQAIRIEVNKEIEAIEESLKQALEIVKVDGTVNVITFHSLEDRVVKDIFWKAKEDIIVTPKGNIQKFKTSKSIYPTKEEIEKNNASRSAKLRTIRKLKE